MGHVSQDSQVPIASQALPHSSTSSGSHLNAHSLQPAVRKSKRRSNMVRELEPHNQSPESDIPQSITAGSTQRALSRPKRKTKMVHGREGHNTSSESDSGPEQEEPLRKTARSTRPTQPKSQRKSVMLREIEAHNLSPEPESDVEGEMLSHLKDDWGDVPLTRSVSNNLVNFVKGELPTPRKNLNLRARMLAEFSGVPKGTKTFYPEDSSIFASSSHQRQQRVARNKKFRDEEEDEEDLPQFAVPVPNGGSHAQRMPSRGITPRQVEECVGDSQRNEKLAAELATMRWANRKGQSTIY